MKKKEPTLVTGCSGFIGNAVCERLLASGTPVVGIDDLNDYYSPDLKRNRLAQLEQHPGFTFRQTDIRDRNALQSVFKETAFSSVYNLAARAGVRYSTINPHVYIETNITGTLNILEEMRARNIGKMVLASTSSLYAGCPVPYNEEQPVNRPLSPYTASKKGAEALCHSYHHLYGMNINIVRYFTVYGPAGRPDMSYFRFIHWIATGQPVQIFGSGKQARDFTYISDIAAGTVKAMEPAGYNIFNLGGGNNPTSILDMIRILEKLLDKKAVLDLQPVDSADMDTTWADIGKADRILDWRPEIALETGLKRCVDWYLENRELVARTLEVLR